jgi:small-conductance mechanosensitive channel
MTILENLSTDQYIRFLLVFLVLMVALTISYVILKIIDKKISGKKTKYSQLISKKLSKPLFLLIFFIGMYTALQSLSSVENYNILIDDIFFILIVFGAAFLAGRIITVLMTGWMRIYKGQKRTPGLISKFFNVIIFIIAVAIILSFFQIDITPLIAGVGLGALAIGLALQSTLSNFFAGLHLLSDKPINVGDFIEFEKDISGVVEDIGWRSTRIRMLTDNLLIIPNGQLAEHVIINYSLPKQDMNVWVYCGVSYQSDLRKVEKVTLEVAKEIQNTVEGAVKDFEPAFRYREFGDSNINFTTILRVRGAKDRFVVRNEFIKALKERYDKEGIEISWPVRKIYNMK